jgi:hypothetical protein
MHERPYPALSPSVMAQGRFGAGDVMYYPGYEDPGPKGLRCTHKLSFYI